MTMKNLVGGGLVKSLISIVAAILACACLAAPALADEEGTPYAVLDESGGLTFYVGEVPEPAEGQTVYTGFETGSYSWSSPAPWHEKCKSVYTVSFANPVAPKSTALWFFECGNLQSIDLSNLDTSSVTSMDRMFYNCSSLTSLDLSGFATSNVTGMNYMFCGCKSLSSLDLSSLDLSNVTNMDSMFSGCSGLENMSLSAVSPTLTYGMFSGCSSLVSLDLSVLDASKATQMGYMFNRCTALQQVTLGEVNPFTGNGAQAVLPQSKDGYAWCKEGAGSDSCYTSQELADADYSGGAMAGTYYWREFAPYAVFDSGNGSLTFHVGMVPESAEGQTVYTGFDGVQYHLSQKAWPWYNVRESVRSVSFADPYAPKHMSCWFCEMSNCTSFDFTNLDASGVLSMSNLFTGCSSVESLDLSGFNARQSGYMSNVFDGCTSLKQVTLGAANPFVGNGSYTTLPNVQDHYSWAKGSADSLERYTSEALKNADYTDGKMAGTYYWSPDIRAYAVFDESDGSLVFRTGTEVPEGAYTGFDVTQYGYEGIVPWYEVRGDITSVRFEDTISPKYTNFWFAGMSNCETMDLAKLDTSNTRTMSYMFDGCSKLASLDVTGFDTSSAVGMASMFQGCESLTSLDLSGFDISKVSSVNYMFYGCSSLESLELSGLVTSNVTDMSAMFCYCSSLTSLDLSSFDTSKVTSMDHMFYDCSSLTSLDLSSFDVSAVQENGLGSMFDGCVALTRVTLGSANPFKSPSSTAYATLPSGGEGYTDYWVKGSQKYLPSELSENYDGATMAGVWRRQLAEPVSLEGAAVALKKTSYTYNGKVQKPAVSSVWLGGEKLVEVTDYEVSYSNASSKAAGSYTVTITGTGNYAGSTAKATYKIAKAANPMSAKGKTVKVKAKKGKAAKKTTFKVTKAFTVKGAQGTVTYKKANKAGKSKITVAKNGKITVKKGLKKGTYKVKIKVTAAGNANYNKGTKYATVKVVVK